MIKIVHLITGLGTGGAEMTLLKLVSRMNRARFQNVVVSLTDRGDLGAEIEKAGLKVESLRVSRGIPDPLSLLALRRILKRERPTILQTWLYHADLLGLMASRFAGVPVLVSNIRCSTIDLKGYHWSTGATIKLLSHFSSIPDAIVVNSREGMRVHEELGYRPQRWEVIPNGFDLDVFRPSEHARLEIRRELGLDSSTRLVGTVARFDPMKDYESLLRAASLLPREQRTHFVLIGSGVDSSNELISRWITEYGLQETVHLLGHRRDIPRFHAAFDVFCSASAFGEGMQNAIGEAMSSGVPAVVTDVGDAAFLVGETGRVVPARNAEALATSLREILSMSADQRRGLGLAARRRIELHFSLPSIVSKYEAFYEELATRKGLSSVRSTTDDEKVIDHFGREWETFSHDDGGSEDDLRHSFEDYFHIFPWQELPAAPVGADIGCGSGRWARFVAPGVGKLYCCDPSAALDVARRTLSDQENCEFIRARADELPIADASLDFAYCLGVLHHVSNTEESLRAITAKLRPGAPFLLYLYYALENRPAWYRLLWRLADLPRRILSRTPYWFRLGASQAIAALVYWPFARLARAVERSGGSPHGLPLAWYRSKRFYFMRADALDRFGTRVEKRFTRSEVESLMRRGGLDQIEFSERPPYWTAVGRKTGSSNSRQPGSHLAAE